MATTDSLSRRLRFAPPQPLGTSFAIQPGDLLVFEDINKHGPLPTNYLFQMGPRTNRNAFQSRLTKLFNGAKNSLPLLSRPPQQFQSFAARYQHLIYDLTKTSEALLRERGTEIIERNDPFLHRFMGACVGASLELAAAKKGLRYIPRSEVLAKYGKTLAVKSGGATFIPDDLFGIQYSDGTYRFFAMEIDRNTESIERRKGGYNTFNKKLEAYLDLMAVKGFKEAWGVPNLLVLIITTNPTHLQNLVAHLGKLGARYEDRFLFKAKSEFGINWKVPDLMTDLLTEPWVRTSAPFDISRV